MTEADLLDIVGDMPDAVLCRLYERAHAEGVQRVEDAAADEMDRRGLCY